MLNLFKNNNDILYNIDNIDNLSLLLLSDAFVVTTIGYLYLKGYMFKTNVKDDFVDLDSDLNISNGVNSSNDGSTIKNGSLDSQCSTVSDDQSIIVDNLVYSDKGVQSDLLSNVSEIKSDVIKIDQVIINFNRLANHIDDVLKNDALSVSDNDKQVVEIIDKFVQTDISYDSIGTQTNSDIIDSSSTVDANIINIGLDNLNKISNNMLNTALDQNNKFYDVALQLIEENEVLRNSIIKSDTVDIGISPIRSVVDLNNRVLLDKFIKLMENNDTSISRITPEHVEVFRAIYREYLVDVEKWVNNMNERLVDNASGFLDVNVSSPIVSVQESLVTNIPSIYSQSVSVSPINNLLLNNLDSPVVQSVINNVESHLSALSVFSESVPADFWLLYV